jgi:hypothetical protein
MADTEPVERKDATERRVYNLPGGLLERLRAYQLEQNISSEAEAARRLLDAALQMRDKVSDILNTLAAKFSEERDLRVLASDVLTRHALVTRVCFGEASVSFTLNSGERGQITSEGALYIGDNSIDDDAWSAFYYPRERASVPNKRPPTPSWDAPKSGGV